MKVHYPKLYNMAHLSLNVFTASKGSNNYILSLKSSEHINEKGDGSYRGFDYLSLVSDPLDLASWSQRELLKFCNFQ